MSSLSSIQAQPLLPSSPTSPASPRLSEDGTTSSVESVWRTVYPKGHGARFSNKIGVILIPTRHEFHEAKLDIWESPDNFERFKKSAIQELRAFMQDKNCSAKEAMVALYQPQGEEDIG